jgi:RHS repeat-associated protein
MSSLLPSMLIQFPSTCRPARTREGHSNDVLYNDGSELNQASGWYETMFKGYDAALGRFLQVDPLAVVDVWVSPFSYAWAILILS